MRDVRLFHNKYIKKKYKKMAIFVLLISLLTSLIYQFDLNLLEAKLYDFRASSYLKPSLSQSIALVVIDDKTVQDLNEFAPLTMDIHSHFLDSLVTYEPKSIGYLASMNQISQNDPDVFENTWSQKFAESALNFIKNGTPFLLGTTFDLTGEIIPPYPLSILPHSVALIHEDGNSFAQDNVSRKAVISIHDKPTFHLLLAQKSNLASSISLPQGSYQETKLSAQFLHFKYFENHTQNFPMFSFIDVLQNKIPQEKLKNKIILVGTLISENPQDFAKTPLSKSLFSYPKILIHANILETIIQNEGIIRMPGIVEWLITLLVISFVFYFSLKYSPSFGLVTTLFITFILLAFGYFLFLGIPGLINGIWLPLSHSLVGILVSYYIVVPFRLLGEYKKRWDFERQNKILMEVEELKSNFLSLVTHDLKTPVAKIQGLTEVLINNSLEKFSPQEKKTLAHILASTDELNLFITKILELAKIESNKINLNLESKDINQIILKSIDHLSQNAELKNITITTQLEPLFPIKVDPVLILKIINNLIDNALKYSYEGSEILVISKDEGDKIRISVKDTGIGMDESEKSNLFTKFYRVKNNETEKIKGTGLGLYLTKYFIDAHKGTIEVETTKGEGTTFSILIPQNLDEIIKRSKKTKPFEGNLNHV